MNWTEERIELLKKLWAEGHSASQIGKVLGVSKNAVVGKAHRMKLAARPSPIKRKAVNGDSAKKDAPVKKAAPKAAKPAITATPKPQVRPAAAKPAPVAVKPKASVAAIAAAAARVAAAKPAAARPQTAAEIKAAALPAKARRKASMDAADRKLFSGAMEKRKGPKCLWPEGDPGDADFHFCGAPAIASKPYCAEHCARAYIAKSSRGARKPSGPRPPASGTKPA